MKTNTSSVPTLPDFSGISVLVIGDLMLDRYLWGKVDRISPEAPVPVVEVISEENRLGGAANVALNLLSLGATPLLCGIIGTDTEGDLLLQEMNRLGLSTQGIHRSSTRRTTAKIRILGHHQQMLRVDKETRDSLTPAEKEALLALIQSQTDLAQAVIFEDYDKGLLSEPLIQQVSSIFQNRNLPITVDPKFRNFYAYSGCTVFKPNLKELNDALGLRLNRQDFSGMKVALDKLREKMPHDWTLLTLSENGALLYSPTREAFHIPAHPRKISDVSGAGDTVISVLTLAMTAGWSPLEAASLANLAGGLVCESPGVVPVTLERLSQELTSDNNSKRIEV